MNKTRKIKTINIADSCCRIMNELFLLLPLFCIFNINHAVFLFGQKVNQIYFKNGMGIRVSWKIICAINSFLHGPCVSVIEH